MLCVVCQKETPVAHGAGRPRKYCSTACRQRAYRQRHEHVAGPARAASACAGSGDFGPVIAVLLVSAALAGRLGQKIDAGPVFEVRILDMTQVQSAPAALPPEAERETSSASDPSDDTATHPARQGHFPA